MLGCHDRFALKRENDEDTARAGDLWAYERVGQGTYGTSPLLRLPWMALLATNRETDELTLVPHLVPTSGYSSNASACGMLPLP